MKNLPELSVRVADGRINKCSLLSTAQLQLGSYRDCGDFAVTKLEGEDLILGMPWLARIDPLILWKKRTLRFVHAGQEHIITETDTQQKRMCHVISAVQFVRQIKKKNPAWICVIKPSDVDKNKKKTKVEVDCSELLKNLQMWKQIPRCLSREMLTMPVVWNLGAHLQWRQFSGLHPMNWKN